MEKISIIVPCYNEQETLPIFYNEVSKVMAEMNNYEFEIIGIDDGSKDRTLEILKELASKSHTFKYISFSRNFGKEAAIYAGLKKSSGDYIVMMDADLQDPPTLLPQLMKAIIEEGYDSAATRECHVKVSQ